MSIDTSQFHQVFFEEAAEHLASLEQLLIAIDIDAPDPEQLNAIFRAAHSIKGGSGIFGFDEMAEFTHELESLLERWRSGRSIVEKDAIDVCLQARDILEKMLDSYRSGIAIDAALQSAAGEIRESLLQYGAAGSNEDSDQGFGFFTDNTPDEKLSADDDGFGFFDDAPSAVIDATKPGADVVLPPVINTPQKSTATTESSSIRVSVEKTDQLINLVGELVITQAMLDQWGSALDPAQHEQLYQALGQLARNTKQLQEAAMSLRMLPINQIFSRFPRLARDLAGKLHKDVELIMDGEHTELDKGLIEKLSDPLTHIVRNSIDHGIETTSERATTGKNPRGKVQLKAFHQGGNIVVEVTDDGRGLQREKILAKARERGLPVSDTMSDAEVWQLIFEPGFSTADEVTDVSGRGVGMDVVRRNIAAMSGRIEVESHAGIGSRICIRLPLTLAILDGMLVQVGAEIYVIPLACIVESLQPQAENINTIAGRGRLIRVRGEYIPLAALHELFALQTERRNTSDAIVVILEASTGTFALEVDALVGQSQVVIKGLETNYRRVDGFSGATILGSGRVAMILDVDGLLRMSHQMQAAQRDLNINDKSYAA